MSHFFSSIFHNYFFPLAEAFFLLFLTPYIAISSPTTRFPLLSYALENSISASPNEERLSAFRRFRVIRQYSSSISIPMLFLPVFIAASIVVPVPQKGSSTVSPQKENILTSREAS